MQIIRGLPGPSHKRPCAVAIGNFDGVHLGHQRLLRAVTQEAHARGLAAAVVTFEPHPRELFGKDPFARICTLRDKMTAIAGCGIDAVYIMPFSFLEKVTICGGVGQERLSWQKRSAPAKRYTVLPGRG